LQTEDPPQRGGLSNSNIKITMRRISFNQVFLGLMLLSFLSAFVVPPRITDAGRVQLEGLFIPISHPTYTLANWIRGRVAPPESQDLRPIESVRQENLELRDEVSRLSAAIESLQGQEAEKKNLGDLNTFCDLFEVKGVDSGNREGLILGGALFNGVKDDQAVFLNGGLVGKIEGASLSGARVRLITEPGFTVSGRFQRFVKDQAGKGRFKQISDLLPIVQGIGGGQMSITTLFYNDVLNAGIVAGDWVTLSESDNNFPAAVHGTTLGRIISTPIRSKRTPVFAEIRLEPGTPLMQLSHVWVMTRQP
jgi:hypothetical protein